MNLEHIKTIYRAFVSDCKFILDEDSPWYCGSIDFLLVKTNDNKSLGVIGLHHDERVTVCIGCEMKETECQLVNGIKRRLYELSREG